MPLDPEDLAELTDARHKAIDHTHYFPKPAFNLRGGGGKAPDGAVEANPLAAAYAGDASLPVEDAFTDADGHFYADIDILSAAACSGSLTVYVWSGRTGAPVKLTTLTFDTSSGPSTYRVNVGGRPFYVAVGALTATETVVFDGVLL